MTGNRKEHIGFLPVVIIVLSHAYSIVISTTLVFITLAFNVVFTLAFAEAAEAATSHSGL